MPTRLKRRTKTSKEVVSKAKRIRFYHNGNQYFNGIMVPVSSERYRSFESLKTDLTDILRDKVRLQHGLETIFTMNGRKVCTINDFEDGKAYVCGGKGEQFKSIAYSDLPIEKHWQTSSSKVISIDNDVLVKKKIPKCVVPKFIVIIRNGLSPRKIMRIFLNQRNAASMEQLVEVLTDAAHLDTGAVRKIFNARGRFMRKLEDIFDDFNQGIFFVYGNEKYRQDDFKLNPQELATVQMLKK